MAKNNYEILSEIELKMPPTKAQAKEREKILRDYESIRIMKSIKLHHKLATDRDNKAIYNFHYPSFL